MHPIKKPVRASIGIAPDWRIAPIGGMKGFTKNIEPRRGAILNSYGVLGMDARNPGNERNPVIKKKFESHQIVTL